MGVNNNIGGLLKAIDKGFVNIGGSMKTIEKILCNIGGAIKEAWKNVYPSFLALLASYSNSTSDWGILAVNLSEDNGSISSDVEVYHYNTSVSDNSGICVDINGYIYVATKGTGTYYIIYKIDPATMTVVDTVTTSESSGNVKIYMDMIAEDRLLFVTSSGKFRVYDTDLNQISALDASGYGIVDGLSIKSDKGYGVIHTRRIDDGYANYWVLVAPSSGNYTSKGAGTNTNYYNMGLGQEDNIVIYESYFSNILHRYNIDTQALVSSWNTSGLGTNIGLIASSPEHYKVFFKEGWAVIVSSNGNYSPNRYGFIKLRLSDWYVLGSIYFADCTSAADSPYFPPDNVNVDNEGNIYWVKRGRDNSEWLVKYTSDFQLVYSTQLTSARNNFYATTLAISSSLR